VHIHHNIPKISTLLQINWVGCVDLGIVEVCTVNAEQVLPQCTESIKIVNHSEIILRPERENMFVQIHSLLGSDSPAIFLFIVIII
jgi:hypothetical protein